MAQDDKKKKYPGPTIGGYNPAMGALTTSSAPVKQKQTKPKITKESVTPVLNNILDPAAARGYSGVGGALGYGLRQLGQGVNALGGAVGTGAFKGQQALQQFGGNIASGFYGPNGAPQRPAKANYGPPTMADGTQAFVPEGAPPGGGVMGRYIGVPPAIGEAGASLGSPAGAQRSALPKDQQVEVLRGLSSSNQGGNPYEAGPNGYLGPSASQADYAAQSAIANFNLARHYGIPLNVAAQISGLAGPALQEQGANQRAQIGAQSNLATAGINAAAQNYSANQQLRGVLEQPKVVGFETPAMVPGENGAMVPDISGNTLKQQYIFQNGQYLPPPVGGIFGQSPNSYGAIGANGQSVQPITATGKNGEKLQLVNGQWVPIK